jgi:hypothetical protein
VRTSGAEFMFHNGSVFDGSRFLPAGTSVRVRGERIAQVGTDPGPLGPAEPVDLAGEDRVRVRVDEPGQQGTAGQVNGLGGPERPEVRADLRDVPAADPHARPGGQEPAAVEDGSVVEHELRTAGSHLASLLLAGN